jgi:RNA polymerase sigma factor (TIGR02999 family)
MKDVTQILSAIEQGDPHAAEQLLPLVYDELRKLAAQQLAGEKPGQTLGATALVHEAYLRLVGAANARPWNGRGHFFAAAAQALRRTLVENARRKGRRRHGGGRRQLAVDCDARAAAVPGEGVLALHDALGQFAAREPLKAQLVELRFFGGLTLAEAAECLGVSLSTADRAWRYARAWLYAAMAGNDSEKNGPGLTCLGRRRRTEG